MSNDKFLELCKKTIVDYFNNRVEITDNMKIMYLLFGVVKRFKIIKR